MCVCVGEAYLRGRWAMLGISGIEEGIAVRSIQTYSVLDVRPFLPSFVGRGGAVGEDDTDSTPGGAAGAAVRENRALSGVLAGVAGFASGAAPPAFAAVVSAETGRITGAATEDGTASATGAGACAACLSGGACLCAAGSAMAAMARAGALAGDGARTFGEASATGEASGDALLGAAPGADGGMAGLGVRDVRKKRPGLAWGAKRKKHDQRPPVERSE